MTAQLKRHFHTRKCKYITSAQSKAASSFFWDGITKAASYWTQVHHYFIFGSGCQSRALPCPSRKPLGLRDRWNWLMTRWALWQVIWQPQKRSCSERVVTHTVFLRVRRVAESWQTLVTSAERRPRRTRLILDHESPRINHCRVIDSWDMAGEGEEMKIARSAWIKGPVCNVPKESIYICFQLDKVTRKNRTVVFWFANNRFCRLHIKSFPPWKEAAARLWPHVSPASSTECEIYLRRHDLTVTSRLVQER